MFVNMNLVELTRFVQRLMLPEMNDSETRVEHALEGAFSALRDRGGPPRLAAAMRYAVFPGGARLRPRLVLEVARALGDPEPQVANAAAAAIELVHCASLVHDDLPAFDGADTRRGRPSVHKEFDEPTAILVGDALIVMAFQVLARPGIRRDRVGDMVLALAKGTGHPGGIVAGQAWEGEEGAALHTYHRAKTASLFEAACALGAVSAGAEPAPWELVGELLGRAYQIADDVADATLSSSALGKPAAQDEAHQRPSAFERLGEERCRALIEQLLRDAADAVPACAGRDPLRRFLREASAGVLEIRHPGLVASARPTLPAFDENRLRAIGN